MSKCTFYVDKKICAVLKTCECDNCKFKKTREELDEARKEAQQSLRSRGLKRVKKTKPNGGEYITVEEAYYDDEE